MNENLDLFTDLSYNFLSSYNILEIKEDKNGMNVNKELNI